MPEELLPIYQIQDFREPLYRKPGFYFNTFASHLKEHAFLQKPHKHDFLHSNLYYRRQRHAYHRFSAIRGGAPLHFFFLAPGQVHAWELAPDTTGFVLFFSPEFYLLKHSQKDLLSFPFFNSLLNKPVLQLPETNEAEVFALLKQIENEFRGDLWKKEEMIRDLLDILLIYLARSYQKQTPETGFASNVSSTLTQFEILLDRHFRERLAISFYAEKLHVTVKQLNELGKKTVGKTPSEMVQHRLLLEAKRLLLHSDLTVTQVAAELGYFDNSYFSRFFKKHTGQTPEQFRQSL